MPKEVLAALVFLAAILAPALVQAQQADMPVKAEAHELHVSTWRPDTKITLSKTDQTVLVDVKCPFGIDRGIMRRTQASWPAEVRIRLHLRGLESFTVSNGTIAMHWYVSRGEDRRTNVTIDTGAGMRPLEEASPYWTSVVVATGKEGLHQFARYFEVPLPAKLFEGNPTEITLHWVDFYRH